jgi:HAE1 family hydrophobic/amphiphilic exporter-1
VNDKIDAILKETPGVKYYTGVSGFSLLSFAFTTYNSFYFVTLEDWAERDKHGLTADVIMRNLNMRLAGLPDAQVFAFSPPVIPGIGTSGGVTFMLEDRAGKDPAFLAENTAKFLARRGSAPSSPCSSPHSCRACRRSSRTSTGTRCSSRASISRRSTRRCRPSWAAPS